VVDQPVQGVKYRVEFVAYAGLAVTNFSIRQRSFKSGMGISFRLMKPSWFFSGLEVVEGAGLRVDAAGSGGGLLNHLIGLGHQNRRDCQADCLRGLQVDRQLELCGLLHRQIRRLCTLQDLFRI
jgi:hypothetical protein